MSYPRTCSITLRPICPVVRKSNMTTSTEHVAVQGPVVEREG